MSLVGVLFICFAVRTRDKKIHGVVVNIHCIGFSVQEQTPATESHKQTFLYSLREIVAMHLILSKLSAVESYGVLFWSLTSVPLPRTSSDLPSDC